MGNCVSAKGPKKDPKRLTEEEIRLLLDNTRLTRQQIVALHNNFLKECPSGKLTKKDFIKLFKEVHPSENKKEKADKFCEYVFKVIDTNNLGYISFQDFVLCFSLTSDGDFKEKCEFAFKLYDLDKDGKISKKEMTQVLEALYDLSGITDRKGNKSPAKKVDEIIKAINAKSALASIDPAAASQSIIIGAGDEKKEEASISISAPADVSKIVEVKTQTIEITAPSVSISTGAEEKSKNENENNEKAADSIQVTVPTVSIGSSSKSDKEEKKEKEKKEKEKKKEKEAKSKEPKPKETKEEKAAKKEKEKQEKERLKQEKEREKKEKAEKAKLEKELKEKEKKEKAELKKSEQTKAKADKSASASSKDKASRSKSPKPAKEQPIEFITKEQFIEACTTDEGIKKLFVDSIFCAQPDSLTAEIGGALAAEANAINVALPSINLDLPKGGVSSKTITLTTTKTTSSSDGKKTIETVTETREQTNGGTVEEILDDLKKKVEVTVDYEKVEIK